MHYHIGKTKQAKLEPKVMPWRDIETLLLINKSNLYETYLVNEIYLADFSYNVFKKVVQIVVNWKKY